MACGTPVVTTDIDGVTEYATDRETALLVAPGDVDELADAIVEVSTSPDLRDHLRDRGLAAAERYSWERSAERLADVCRRVS
jgi:glycosyltransferase involved in cell wall biosynthesis